MENAQLAWVIMSSLLSGLIGVGVSTYFYVRYEIRKSKLETLRRFAGNRYDITSHEFRRALNEIFIIFNKSRQVMITLSEFHEKTTQRYDPEESYIKLFKAMCDDVRLPYNEFNDSFFLKPFNIVSTSKSN